MFLYIWFVTVTDPFLLWNALWAEPSRTASGTPVEASLSANESTTRFSPAVPKTVTRLPSRPTASAARTVRTGRDTRATTRSRRPAATAGSSRYADIHRAGGRARCAEHTRTA